jgi:hypothetical protein
MIAVALAALLGASVARGQEAAFETLTYYHESGHLRYRLHSPAAQPGVKLPLVVYLHGAVKRGDDNQAQLGMAAIGRISSGLSREPAYILAPQCPRMHEGFALTKSSKAQGILGYGLFTRTNVDQWVPFTLPIGRYLAGPKRHFTIIVQAGEQNTEAVKLMLRSVQIRDARNGKLQPIKFNIEGMVAYPVVPRSGARPLPSPEVADAGASLTVSANPRMTAGLAMPLEVTIEPWMELVFEAKSNTFNERAMSYIVGFDTDLHSDAARWSLDWELSPKSPEARYGEQPNPPLLRLLALVKELRDRLPNVDPDRIYIGGHSMGGFGTWEAIIREPQLFAAAVPTAGGGDSTQAARVAHMPIWAGHARRDGIVSSAWTAEMVNALQAIGAPNVKVTWFDSNSHMIDGQMWGPEVVEWMFSQRRGAASAKK